MPREHLNRNPRPPASPDAVADRIAASPTPSARAPRRRGGCVRGAPGSPPSAPGGAWRRRSVSSEKLMSVEGLELAHDAVAAAMTPGAARPAAQRVLGHAQRELELERLDGRVERVRHRDVDGARPVGVRAGALAAAERLVVGPRVGAEGEVVHGALAQRAAEGAEHEVGHARRRLDVAAGDRRGRARVEQRALGRDDRDRAVGAGAGRDVGVGEHAHGEQARAAP